MRLRATSAYRGSKGKAKKVNKTERTMNPHYTSCAYAKAIRRKLEELNPMPAVLPKRGKTEGKVAWLERLTPAQRQQYDHWEDTYMFAPNQLRHTYGTVVRATDGLEAAQVLLGHSKADVTQIYAERDTERAKSVALKIG